MTMNYSIFNECYVEVTAEGLAYYGYITPLGVTNLFVAPPTIPRFNSLSKFASEVSDISIRILSDAEISLNFFDVAAGFKVYASDPKCPYLKEITEIVVKLDTADSNTIKAFFKWVSASISTGSQKVDNGQKEVIGLNDLPPPPPEVNIVL